MRPHTYAVSRKPTERRTEFLTGCWQPSPSAARDGLNALIEAADPFQNAENVHPFIAGLLVAEA